MKSIITGDVVKSTQANADEWLPALQKALRTAGKEKQRWEIFRGDSFQVKTKPEDALTLAMKIKSSVKRFKDADVRMAIGIGTEEYKSETVSTSNGPAYVHSGESFEALGKRLLSIKSPWPEMDQTLNLMFDLMCLTANNWTGISAEFIYAALGNPGLNQKDLAQKIKKSQPTLSEGLRRGGYNELQELLKYYQTAINTYVQRTS